MNEILCIQISTHLINGKPDNKDIATRYYATLYNTKNKDGYYKGYHFWEIPQWITEINHNTNVDFYTCTNIKDCVNHICNKNYKYVCFSVLDVNKSIIHTIIDNVITNSPCNESTFILGGYINLNEYFSEYIKYNYVKTFKTVKDFITFLGIEYKQGFNYKLFKDYETIPRLTLSTGCTNKCDFCTVEKQIKKIPLETVYQQCEAFKPLKFKLVYINDKTFGQCANYKILPWLYEEIKEYNPCFEGFIIQTTTTQFNKLDNKFIYAAHIKYIELGIETFNNDILKQYHKPSTTKTTIEACKKIRYYNEYHLHCIQLIPNIICGIPEETIETYKNTLRFIKNNSDIISHFNIYSLAVYDNTPLSNRLETRENDSDENSLDKSFLHGPQHKQFYNAIHKLAIDLLIRELYSNGKQNNRAINKAVKNI